MLIDMETNTFSFQLHAHTHTHPSAQVLSILAATAGIDCASLRQNAYLFHSAYIYIKKLSIFVICFQAVGQNHIETDQHTLLAVQAV